MDRAAPDGPAIAAHGLRHAYGDRLAVDDVSVEVRAGEVLGLLGPNGAGKSTVIKCLTGQLRPDAGAVQVLGVDLLHRPDRVQGRIGVCFEEKNLYGDMSARENLRFFGRLFGLRLGRDDVDAMLERVDLTGRGTERVDGFSKGMKQRLMIARSLVNRPDVLFLDEPTDGLDPVSARAIRRIIHEEAERGAAVLLTTHDMFEADRLADRLAFINQGRILAVDTPESFKLAHGTRTISVRVRVDGEVSETVVDLDEHDAEQRVAAAMAEGQLLTVHTTEATLEEVFVSYAGRGLT